MRMQCKGLTLIELLVAIAIFSLMAGAGYIGLDQGLSVEKKLKTESLHWRRLESVYTLMQTDLNQAIKRVPKVSSGAEFAFTGYGQGSTDNGDLLYGFNRGGQTSFLDRATNPYQYVSYYLSDGTLYRSVQSFINASEDTTTAYPILSEVNKINMSYLISSNTWTDGWPQSPNPADPTALPRAVRVNLVLANNNAYEWIFNVGVQR